MEGEVKGRLYIFTSKIKNHKPPNITDIQIETNKNIVASKLKVFSYEDVIAKI